MRQRMNLDTLPKPLWYAVFNIVRLVPYRFRGDRWWAVWRAL